MSKIVQGAKNYLLKDIGYVDSKIEDIAKERKEVCDNCEFKMNFPVERCSVCSCFLAWKQRSNSECPKNKWSK